MGNVRSVPGRSSDDVVMAATSPSFAQIWSGVQTAEYDDGGGGGGEGKPQQQTVRPPPKPKTSAGRSWQIVWRNVVGFAVLHAIACYGFYVTIAGHVYLKTILCGKRARARAKPVVRPVFVPMPIGSVAKGFWPLNPPPRWFFSS